MMDKTNLPKLILSRLDKLSTSVFIKRIFLTRGLSLVFSKHIPTSQIGLEILHLTAMLDIIFFLISEELSNTKFVCKIK